MTFHVPVHRRGLLAVQANGAPLGMNKVLAELQTGFDDFKRSYGGRVDQVEASIGDIGNALDDIAVKLAAAQMNGGLRERPADPEYSAAFLEFARTGERAQDVLAANKTGRLGAINASMATSPGSAGGYLAPVEWDRAIVKAQQAVSPIRRLANVINAGKAGYSTLWSSGGWGSGWVGETAVRPETTTNTFAELKFGVGEIYASPAVTQTMLDDSEIDLAAYLETEVGDEFGRQEAVAFVAGNGVSKPAGLLTFAVGGVNAAAHPGGALDTVTVAATTVITPDELIDFFYGLAAPYRQNAIWLMSSTSVRNISKLKDANDAFLWREGLIAGQPATLLGRPVEIDENMPSMVAGALPIALGDFRAGYNIVDRQGIRVLRDPFSNKPFVHFYCTRRVGGGVRDNRAIRVMKMAAA